jgi:hypothetical protein
LHLGRPDATPGQRPPVFSEVEGAGGSVKVGPGPSLRGLDLRAAEIRASGAVE